MAHQLETRLESSVLGQGEAVRGLLVAWLSGGHLLLEGPPGTGKTRLAQALSAATGLAMRRIQFTPDLLPSDLLGTAVSNPTSGAWTFHHGPLEGTHLILVDDIDRAPAATQSALLEALGEGAISVEGNTLRLASPFLLVATRSPESRHGTHPLTLSELDRFSLGVRLDFPGKAVEQALLSDPRPPAFPPLVSAAEWQALRHSVNQVFVSAGARAYIVALADALRRHPLLALGPSPRASQSLESSARAQAAVEGRDYVLPDDIKAMAALAWRHRLGLSPVAMVHGVHADDILHEILGSVPVGWQPGSSSA